MIGLPLFVIQISRLKDIVTLVVIAGINTFHINFTVVDFVRQCRTKERFDFNVFNRASLHSEQVIVLVDLTPVNHLIFDNPLNVPTSKVSSRFSSNNSRAFFLLAFSSARASSAESVMPNLFSLFLYMFQIMQHIYYLPLQFLRYFLSAWQHCLKTLLGY